MSRYIDADRIEDVIINDVPLKYFRARSYNGAIRNGLKIAEILNDKIPTADVKEVKHGQWLKHYQSGVIVSEGFVSSCCNMWNERKSNYCPNCGAPMDGGDEE